MPQQGGNDVPVWVLKALFNITSVLLRCRTCSIKTMCVNYQTFPFWEVPQEPKGHAEGRDISMPWPRREQATPCLRLNEKNKASFSGFNQSPLPKKPPLGVVPAKQEHLGPVASGSFIKQHPLISYKRFPSVVKAHI